MISCQLTNTESSCHKQDLLLLTFSLAAEPFQNRGDCFFPEGQMESSSFNDSDVTSAVSGMAESISGAPNVTSFPSSISQEGTLTQDVVSSIPLLIQKLFSKAAEEADLQTKDTIQTHTTGNTTADVGLNLFTDLDKHSDTSRTGIDLVDNITSTVELGVSRPAIAVVNTTTATMKLESEENRSPLIPQQEPSVSTTSASLSVETGIDKQSVFGRSATSLNVETGIDEENLFRRSTETGYSPDLLEQSTEVNGAIRPWITNDSQISDLSTEFQNVTMRLSSATETDVTQMAADKTFPAEFPSTDFSSVLQSAFNTSREAVSTLQFNTTFNTVNVTISPVTSFDFLNNSNNATDVGWQYPAVYDVIIDQYDDSPAVAVAKVTTLAILALAGVVGNALVIWSVVRQRHLHRPPFYYLLSLSLTDLSRAAFCLPLVLMTLLQGSVWRHGTSACDLFAFANAFFVLSSGVSLLDIAADRHLSLVYSRSYRRRSGGALNLVVVLLGWSLAFLVAFPPVVGVGSYAFQESEGQCTLRHKFYRHNNDTLGFLMVFTALMMVTLFLYYRIFLALRAQRKMRPLDHEPARSATWTFVGPGANGQAFVNWVNGFGGTQQLGNIPNLVRNPPRPNITRLVNLHVARNQHVTRLFFLMTLTFNALWLPYQVLSYWRVFGWAEEIEGGFVTAAAWLSYGQVAVCPAVYFSSRGPARPRPSRADLSPQDKQEFLLESVNRKK